MKRIIVLAAALVMALVATIPAEANHSWGGYHWARTANPFTLKLSDNVTSAWDTYLAEASTDWSASSVLNTMIAPGSANVKRCAAAQGRVEVCNARYGYTGWLGVAGITISGGHITGAYVKLNDTYFTGSYNTPAWRRLVTCQEIAHTFGLHHQDENFSNANLGSCMDYTDFPSGPPSNEHPNAHDFSQLESIYSHLDGSTTVGQSAPRQGKQSANHSQVEKVDRHGNGTVTWTFWTK